MKKLNWRCYFIMVDYYFDEDTCVEIVKEIKLSKHNILGSLEDIPTFPHALEPGIQSILCWWWQCGNGQGNSTKYCWCIARMQGCSGDGHRRSDDNISILYWSTFPHSKYSCFKNSCLIINLSKYGKKNFIDKNQHTIFRVVSNISFSLDCWRFQRCFLLLDFV